MMKNRTRNWIGIAVLLTAAVYSVVLFLVKSKFDQSSWFLYGFTIVAFAFLFVETSPSAHRDKSIIMDTALRAITLVYFLLQFIGGGIICMRFSGLPFAAVLVGEAILFTAYLVFAFLIFGPQRNIAIQDQNDRGAIRKHHMRETEVRAMAEKQSKADVRTALEQLAEELHYSEICLLPELTFIEDKIDRDLLSLKDELANEDINVLERIETIRLLVKERNQKAILLKQ